MYTYTYILYICLGRMMEMACNKCTDDVLNDGDDMRCLCVWYCVVLSVGFE